MISFGKSKRPQYGDGWHRNAIATVQDISRHFNGATQNIGVVLGQGTADVDLDCRAAAVGAPYLLPPTRRFGRAGKPRSHWIYQSHGLDELEPAATRKFSAPDGETLLELRSGGSGHAAQTVFPPSTHESGETIEWVDAVGKFASVDPADIVLRCKLLAVACLLGRAFPNGGRHDL
jgi:hypothetical protein